MLQLQSVEPAGQEELQLRDREGVEQRLQQRLDLRQLHRHAVHAQADGVVLRRQALAQGLGLAPLRRGGVDDDDEGLTRGLQVRDGAALGLQIIGSVELRDAAVGRDDDSGGTVLGDDLLCP